MNCSTTRICWISTLLKQKRNRNFDPLYLVYTHISYTTVIAYEARYSNLGAIPIPDTVGIWILPGYRCMCTPGLSHFFPKKKKKILGTVWVRAGLKAAKITLFFRQKLFNSHSLFRSIFLSLPSSLYRHSLTQFSLSLIITTMTTKQHWNEK